MASTPGNRSVGGRGGRRRGRDGGGVLGTERFAALQVAAWVDEMAVPLDVTVLGADHEHDQVVVTGVREASRRGRLDVDEAAGADLTHVAVDLESGRARVDEIELVLR